MGIHERIGSVNDKTRGAYHDAIGEHFTGGYDDIGCCDCRSVIKSIIKQSTDERDVELQKMKCQSGEERICAVRHTPVEKFSGETLCGISYVTEVEVINWLKDRGLGRCGDAPVPIDKPLYGRYSDITCRECRDVIEYYQKSETSNTSSP
jgi:hypothetical protein